VRTNLQDIPYVLGNASELREVLTNLIFNSVDAMPSGGSITVSTQQASEGVAVSVTDTGSGMTESERERCLEPFFTTKGEGGTGLGLSVVYGIVQRHGGKIDIASQVGVGTTFSVHLPATMATETIQESPSERIDRTLRVLVVDDQEIINELLAEHLKSDGHVTACAQNGQEALALFRSESFDLVITDQSMPGMNGVQLAGAIKEVSPKTRVILLTGFGEEMMAAGGCPPGVDLVVGKPVSHDNLRNAIFQVMASSEMLESVS
jgi:CheY-like chemotaxis protein